MDKNNSSLGLIWAVLLSVSFAMGLNAQIKADATGSGTPGAVGEKVYTGGSPIDIYKQPGKQGGLPVTRRELTVENSVRYSLHNNSGKSVQAYALLIVNDNDRIVRTMLYFEKPIGKGEDLDTHLLTNGDYPEWVFDWILFTDGSTWGSDNHGRSAEISGFIKGRSVGHATLAKIVSNAETSPILSYLKVSGFRVSAMDVSRPKPDTRTAKEYFDEGYDSPIRMVKLYLNHKKDESARQIIERLTEMRPASVPK